MSTRHLASPVARGNFFHDSNFYVEVADSSGFRKERFTREDSGSLYRLLTYTPPNRPALTKARKVAKRQPPPYIDRTAAFFCAQLIHYGLKQYKTKEAAKKHLLQAFDAAHYLKVPENILLIEKELKAEYNKANVEAERLYEEKRRKEMERDYRKGQEEQSQNAALMKELRAIADMPVAGTDDAAAMVKRLSDKSLKDAIKVMPEGDLRKIVAKAVKDLPELRDAIEMQVSKSQKTIQKVNKAKNVLKVFFAVAHLDILQPVNNLTDCEFQGHFNVAVPFMSKQWNEFSSDEVFTLKMSHSTTFSHLWGKFEFGGISGIFRSVTSTLPHTFPGGYRVDFLWRGEEFGEGQSSFGEDNKGYIVFLGDGRIKGNMQWMGTFDFAGKHDTEKSRNVVWVKSIPHWKRVWRGYNWHNYEVANRARWGKWGGETRNEKAADSDTTTGSGNSRSDDEDAGDSDCGYHERSMMLVF
ncbi:hypothetical protein J3R30DRAFT_3286718 [Lentinula aciculospora]|uniref:Uncharacterized protein n=1 Tax=Lentinula aciculospora TaxID=153920 RepID=A0A9W9AIU8_9AGAR|nr:hypothetical protein J3R30DRAFT_3286718 [Lentinula aciculospora]